MMATTSEETQTYRVRVFDEVYTIRATGERQAKSRACGRYIRSRDWFATDSPWKTVPRHCEIVAN